MHMSDFNWKSRWSWPATTTSSRPPPTCTIRRLWTNDALFLPQTRARFRALTSLGLTDAIRAVSDDPGLYTFWDYQAGAWQKNWGIRIDHLLLSPQAADRLTAAGIDKHVRSWEQPSDHVPVYVDLAIDARLNAGASKVTAARPSTQRSAARGPARARRGRLLERAFAQFGDPAPSPPGPSLATVSHIRPAAAWRVPCSPLNRMRPSTACALYWPLLAASASHGTARLASRIDAVAVE